MNIESTCSVNAGYLGGPSISVIEYKNCDFKVTAVEFNVQCTTDWKHADLNKLCKYEPGLDEVIVDFCVQNLFFLLNSKKPCIKIYSFN